CNSMKTSEIFIIPMNLAPGNNRLAQLLEVFTGDGLLQLRPVGRFVLSMLIFLLQFMDLYVGHLAFYLQILPGNKERKQQDNGIAAIASRGRSSWGWSGLIAQGVYCA